jgi:hypothetical protein
MSKISSGIRQVQSVAFLLVFLPENLFCLPISVERSCRSKTGAANHWFSPFSRFRFDLPEAALGIKLNRIIKLAMSNVAKESSSASDLLKNSTLYREFQAEREEILRHKWIESEKAGHDIGFERALTDWIIKHRASWRKSRQAAPSN